MSEFTIGIEEEFFLSDARTRNARPRAVKRFLSACQARAPGRISTELLQLQIETNTGICESAEAARRDLESLRRVVIGEATRHGIVVFAAGTHPLADWAAQIVTRKKRYDRIVEETQMIARRNVLCGLHVHVAVPDPNRRVEIMNRAVAYLPLLLALSTSSPFWQRHLTGLKGYRLAAYDEWPRTGLPPAFATQAEYDGYIDTLKRTRIIPDASHIWWAIRPSERYPTLEFRVMDACPRLDDVVALAALCRCLVHRLHRDASFGFALTAQRRALIEENRWRVQRFGLDGSVIDIEAMTEIQCRDATHRLIDALEIDAEILGCVAQLDDARCIVARGTAADRQIEIYRNARLEGWSRQEALRAVVDWLVATTAVPAATDARSELHRLCEGVATPW